MRLTRPFSRAGHAPRGSSHASRPGSLRPSSPEPRKGHGDPGVGCEPARPRASCGRGSKSGRALEGLYGQKQGGSAPGEEGTGSGERSARRWPCRCRRSGVRICLGAKRGSGPGRRRGAEARTGRGRQGARASSSGSKRDELSFRAVPRRARAAQPRRRGRPPTPASASPTAVGVGLVG